MFARKGAAVIALWSLAVTLAASTAPHAAEDRHSARPRAGAARPVEADTRARAGALRLTLQDAILSALSHNRGLRVEALSPAITRAAEGVERAAFDPVAGATFSYERTRDDAAGRTPANRRALTEERSAEVAIEEFLPTGATLALTGTAGVVDSSLYSDRFASTRVGLSVTQALLRGMPVRVNLARLRQARLDTRISEYELRAFTEMLVAAVEKAYWDYALAGRRIAILRASLELADKQLRETTERVNVGTIARSESAAARAEVALRHEELIDANSALTASRLTLLRLVNPGGAAAWDLDIALLTAPAVSPTPLDPAQSHVAVALRMRPDLNQARLSLRRGELDVVRTRNGLLPRMDAFLTIGTTGYAKSFGRSVEKIDGRYRDFLVGVELEVPVGNRAARAQHRSAVLTRRQLVRAIDNLAELAALEVRTACVEVERARRQVTATATTRRLREESLAAESEKFKVGKSTSFLVASAQRDLLATRLREVQAVVAHLAALVDLYRVEGSLLERRGLQAPGREPVPVTAPAAR